MPPLQQRLPRRTLQDLSSVTAVHTFNQHWPGTARPQTPRRTTTSQAVHLQGTLNAIVTTRTATRTSSHLPNPAPKYRQGLRLLPFHMGPRDLAPPAVSCKRRRLKRRPLRIPCSLRKRLRAPRMLQGLRRPTPFHGSRLPTTGPSMRACHDHSTWPTASGPTAATAHKPFSPAASSTRCRNTNDSRHPR